MERKEAAEQLRDIISLLIKRKVLANSEHEWAISTIEKVKAYIKNIEHYDSVITNLETWKSIPIRELKLSIRTSNCLNAENIESIGDLLERSIFSFAHVPNFGKHALAEIEIALAKRGLVLKALTHFS